MNTMSNIGRRVRITAVGDDHFRRVLIGQTGTLIPPSAAFRSGDVQSETDVDGDYWVRLDPGQAPYHPFGMTMLKAAEEACASPGQFEYLDTAD